MAHVPTFCTHCGQVDDHPKSHWNTGESFHFDCLPYEKKTEFLDSHPLAAAHVQAAEGGLHGEELRAHLAQIHADYAAANPEA